MVTQERTIGWSAAACWLAAWFLPVVDGYPGWAAFRTALTGPFREDFMVRGDDSIVLVLSAITNFAFVGLFAAWARGRITHAGLYLKITIACLLLNLYWPVQMLRAGERSVLLAGYYMWLAAFALLVALGAVIVVSARRTSKTPTAGTPA